jgi:hypothetical protein
LALTSPTSGGRLVGTVFSRTEATDLLLLLFIFHFGVLHPVARALSRLSEKNGTSQQLFKVFIVFYTSTVTCFGPHWPSSDGIHNIIYKEVIILTTDPLSVVQIVLCTLFDKCCSHLYKCDCEVSIIISYTSTHERYLEGIFNFSFTCNYDNDEN